MHAVKSPRSGRHLGVQTMPSELGFFPSFCYAGVSSQGTELCPTQQWIRFLGRKYRAKLLFLEAVPLSWH